MKDSRKIILDLLEVYLDRHPEMRFAQALHNAGIINKPTIFYDTDEEVLKRILGVQPPSKKDIEWAEEIIKKREKEKNDGQHDENDTDSIEQ